MVYFVSKIDAKKIAGKTALLRLDFNTEDDWRMRAVLPTIKFLLKKGCKVIIMSHRGRPQPRSLIQLNKRMSMADQKLSLKKDAVHLSRLLGRKVTFIDHFDFARIQTGVAVSSRGSLFLLENLRFLPGEEKNDPKLARRLASLGDFYVNDAFAVSHRANASIVAITKFLPSYAGFELEAEIAHLSRIIVRPKRPFVMVVGGAKVADKLGILRYFRNRADKFLLGGGPANTMLSVRGMDVKNSLRDIDGNSAAITAIAKYRNLVLPVDYVWHKDMIVDVGSRSCAADEKMILAAKTIVWSGPFGLIDVRPYDRGSRRIANAIAKNRKALSVAGGGETVMFLKRIHLEKKFTFISTGGGAMLDFLAGKKLPGIEALKNPFSKTYRHPESREGSRIMIDNT
jgi:phosphoglycerate kinase